MATTALLIAALFFLLGTGVWIGLALTGVAWIGMELFTTRPVGDSMAVTIWGATSSWTLTALPLFIWMGEILFRSKMSEDMFRGLAPWMTRLPGRLLHLGVRGGAEHRAEHKVMLDELGLIRERLDDMAQGTVQGEPGFLVLNFVLGVTIGHIFHSDMQYCVFARHASGDEMEEEEGLGWPVS